MSSPTVSLSKSSSSSSIDEDFEPITANDLKDCPSPTLSFREKIQPGLDQLGPGIKLVASGSGVIAYETLKKTCEVTGAVLGAAMDTAIEYTEKPRAKAQELTYNAVQKTKESLTETLNLSKRV